MTQLDNGTSPKQNRRPTRTILLTSAAALAALTLAAATDFLHPSSAPVSTPSAAVALEPAPAPPSFADVVAKVTSDHVVDHANSVQVVALPLAHA